MKQEHFHVDVMTVESRPIWSSTALPKSAAERLFKEKVSELRLQVGKFHIRPARAMDWERGFVGAVRIAQNHRVIIVLSRCDCDA